MEVDNGDRKKKAKNSVLKKLERFMSFDRQKKPPSYSSNNSMFTKSRSWHSSSSSTKNKAKEKAPIGCFSVYVGPENQRFVIKAECANHPLFKMLLEDAESEYGFKVEGPLRIPCEVDLFCRILAEMDSNIYGDQESDTLGFGCSPFSPARRSGKGGTGYGLLTPPRLLKINHF
ncbi:hypothetical protein ABFS82_04G122700 [Erythranthe guttata]|uniref:Uncharacterized protein n=1 Tax=Erythranthe guttata TaxID=4155 RepID=A0A022RSJ4_ERYGU|nr:PREDICTED: uncharacterized protein LOC105951646 [Erythranthe guttata]EYU43034.1 hypothetical protein MIMGU_mgv1a014941mg [Erythranthe guttata]|eukprot:XP_012830550.1 PREDICTED: uncharacterized protein LOC105951646 [Erythranthe guttata]